MLAARGSQSRRPPQLPPSISGWSALNSDPPGGRGGGQTDPDTLSRARRQIAAELDSPLGILNPGPPKSAPAASRPAQRQLPGLPNGSWGAREWSAAAGLGTAEPPDPRQVGPGGRPQYRTSRGAVPGRKPTPKGKVELSGSIPQSSTCLSGSFLTLLT